MSWIENQIVTVFETLNITELNVDEAWLNVSSTYNNPLWMYELSSNCHQCPFKRIFPKSTPLLPGLPQVFKINTQFRSRYRLRTDGALHLVSASSFDSNIFCEVENSGGEFGVYELLANADADMGPKCSIVTKLKPVNIYYPIAVVTLFYICLAIAIFLWRKYGPKIGIFLRTTNIFGHVDADDEGYIGISSPSVDSGSSGSVHILTSSSDNDTIESGTRRRRKRGEPKLLQKRLDNKGSMSQLQNANENVAKPIVLKTQKQRFESIDTFRGICIVIMIFADDGGGLYHFFQHCTWDGLYVADLAFPWFLWIMGVCIPISIRSQKSHCVTRMKIFKRILIRSLKLILLGVAMNTSTSPVPVAIEKLRFLGVLQRFGICYFLASTMFLFLVPDEDVSSRVSANEGERDSMLFKDLRISVIPWMIIIFVVTAHCLITFLLPIPGCPTGYLGPAGLHMENKYPANCIGGSAGYVDRIIFSENHIYARPRAKRVYKTGSFDPEGVLGILTSLFQVWLGVHTGIILLTFSQPWSRIKRTLIWAVISGLLGSILCGGTSNIGWIPVNKNLWSISFVFVTSSMAWALLSLLYFVIDVRNFWSGAPFFKAGMNSILLYVGHDVAHSMIPWNYAFGQMNTHISHLMESLWGTSLWIIFSIYLYDRKLFWNI